MLHIAAHGVDVDAATLHGRALPLAQKGFRTTVDLGAGIGVGGPSGGGQGRLGVLGRWQPQSVVVEYAVDDELGTVEVPLAPGRAARALGWTRLVPSTPGVLAYLLLDSGVDGAPANSTIDEKPTRSRGSLGTLILLPHVDTANFMTGLPDDTPLGALTLQGSHETCAFYGYFASQCQCPTTPVARQLIDGVRVFDVRLRVVDGKLKTYHDIRPQRSTLTKELAAFNAFLLAHPGETVLVSIKEETPPWHPAFPTLVYRELAESGLWRFEETVPTLGEVRGRGILFSRFARWWETEFPDGMGIHPTRWPDSKRDGFEWDCHGVTVRTHDWYHISSLIAIPEKAAAVVGYLEPTTTPDPPGPSNDSSPPLTLAFASGSGSWTPPRYVSRGVGYPQWGLGIHGVNARVVRWLLQCAAEGRRPRAAIMVDFYRHAGGEGSMSELLCAMNYLEG